MKYPPLTQLHGVFGVIKPRGITAAKTCKRIRNDLVRELEFIRPKQIVIEYSGTLDRQSTGVLPIGLGNGCKLLKKLLNSDKIIGKYICQAELGVGNSDGVTTQKLPYEHITRKAMEHALKSFVGKIQQTDKVKGKDLSDLTSESTPESKPFAEPRTAHHIVCTAFNLPHFTIEVHCTDGFLIRRLVREIGIALGSFARIIELERIAHGELTTAMCIPAFHWTLNSILEAIERYTELQEMQSSEFRQDCSQ